MRQQIEREFAASKVERMAAQKMESIKQASAGLRARKEKGKAEQDKTLKNPRDEVHRAVKSERNDETDSKKRARKMKKQPNPKTDLKYCEDSTADRLSDLVAEGKDENKELITSFLDILWRRRIDCKTLTGKDFKAMEAAKGFLRKMNSKTS